MQAKAEEIASKIVKPGIIVVEAAMGQGKTEAALVCAEIFAQKCGAAGIFFALPTQATSDGLFPRIKDWLSTFDEENRSIRLAHGKAQFNELYSGLTKSGNASNLYEFEGKTEQVVQSQISVHTWFEGSKKALLDHFVVGTIDQLLLAALKQRHFMLRHLGMAGKVVVIDECHAFDAYMNIYLKRSLEWLGAYGVPVILLSATLSKHIRRDLVNAYLSGRQYKKINDALVSNKNSYPIISYTDGDEYNETALEDNYGRKKVFIEKLDDTKLIDLLKDKLCNGGCAGIIVNTVRRSQELYKAISEIFEGETVLLHSSFIAPDRAEKEKTLLYELSNNIENRPKRKIVIGTQIFEQSFNVDFDLLITELCPIDLLLQRIGRLHRFDITRQSKLVKPSCIILQPEGKAWNTGTEKVYPAYLLHITNRILPNEINIPDDIPILVQRLYEGEGEFEEEKQKYLNNVEGSERKASAFEIQAPLLDDVDYNIISFLEYGENLDEKAAEAKVRDSDPSIEVLLVNENQEDKIYFKHKGKSYGIIKNMIIEDEAAKALACQRIRLPRVLCAYGNLKKTIEELERINLNKFASLQQNSWIKGELILPILENGYISINNWRLRYDDNYGLIYEKEGMDE